jgi:hypothetical protein
MLTYSAKSFDELATPLSRNKILLLIEITDPIRAEQIDLYSLILGGLGIDRAPGNVADNFLDRGYLTAETEISDRNKNICLGVIESFRQSRIQDIAKAYLFIDEQFVEHSRDGLPSMFDLVAQLPVSCYRVK